MKRCPACGAEYEPHVEYCFSDGSLLREGAFSPATPRLEPPAPQPSRLAWIAGVLIGIVLIGLLAVVGLTLFLFSEAPDRDPATEAIVAPAPEVIYIGFTSSPEGATVSEEGTPLCTTPCTVHHSDEAPLPRRFRLQREGYLDALITVHDPWRPHHATLQEVSTPAPEPRPRPRPRPSPRPRPAPSPGSTDKLEIVR